MRRVLLVLAIVLTLAIAILIAAAFMMSGASDTAALEDPHDVTINIPSFNQYGGPRFGRHLDISPDGKTIVYVGWTASESRRLFVQKIGEVPPVELRGVDVGNRDIRDPTFSPDGRYIAYWAQGDVMKASLDGREPSLFGKVATTRGIAWLDSDTLVLSNLEGGLLRLSASQEKPSLLVEPKSGEPKQPVLPHVAPQVLPGNKAVLFTLVNDSFLNARIGVLNLATGEERLLLEENAFSPRYLSSGHIMFARGAKRELMAARFDLSKLEIVGEAKPVLKVPLSGSGHATDYAVSETGVLVYTPNRETGLFDDLAWFGGRSLSAIHVRLKWFEELNRLLP